MIFYFDENLPKQLAHALNELDRDNEILSVKDHFEGMKDIELIPEIAKLNAILITHDKRMKKNRAERMILEEYNLTVFFSSSNLDYWTTVIMFVKNWEKIVSEAKRHPQGVFIKVTPRKGIENINTDK